MQRLQIWHLTCIESFVHECLYRVKDYRRFFSAQAVSVHLNLTPFSKNGREDQFTITELDDSVFIASGKLNSNSDFNRNTYFPPSFLLLILYQHMSIIQTILSFANSLLTFYIPIFFTFRYLMLNNSEKVRAILKFWCILTLYSLIQQLLQFVIKGYIAVIVDIAILTALNINHFEYAEIIYDQFVSPFFKTHQESIQKYTDQLQKLFTSQSQRIKDKVATSAGDKIKGFMGEVLVGVLNPAPKSNKTPRDSRDSKDTEQNSDEEREKDE